MCVVRRSLYLGCSLAVNFVCTYTAQCTYRNVCVRSFIHIKLHSDQNYFELMFYYGPGMLWHGRYVWEMAKISGSCLFVSATCLHRTNDDNGYFDINLLWHWYSYKHTRTYKMLYRLNTISLSISFYLRLIFFEKFFSQFSIVYKCNDKKNDKKIHQREVTSTQLCQTRKIHIDTFQDVLSLFAFLFTQLLTGL